ncbi:hypothetical protein AAE478_009560 [Parahypoxylon ruwenzoriense]
MPRPLRSSCDRCHSQKLKCPKQPGVATCTRCLKAGTNCVFSPAAPSARRIVHNPVYPDRGLNVQFDWSALDLEAALVTPPEAPPEASQGILSGAPQQAEQAEAASQDPRSSLVHQLSALATEINQVSLDLSPISQIHVPRDLPTEDLHAKFVGNLVHQHCVEQLFAVAQRLTELYPQALKTLFDRPEPVHCRDPNCFHAVELPAELDGFFPAADEGRDDIDAFLLGLVVSCHTKLMDVMGILIICVKTCSQITLASPDLLEPDVHIPEVRVGGFVATHTAASKMQSVLLIYIASVLLDYARQLRMRIANAVERGQNSKQGQLFQLQCELLEEKSASRMEQLERVKAIVTKLDFMK